MYREETLLNRSTLGYWRDHFTERADFYVGALVMVTVAAIGVYAVAKMAPAALVAFYVFGLVGLFVAARMGASERRLFLTMFCLNVLFALALYGVYMSRYGTPYLGGGSDDVNFEEFAKAVAEMVAPFDYAGIDLQVSVGTTKSYVYLLSWLYRLSVPFGGFDTLEPRLLNALMQSLIALLVFRSARDRLGLRHETSLVAGLAAGLLPMSMYVSAHTLRDPVITFMLVLLLFMWSGAANLSLRRWALLLLITVFLLAVMWDMRQRIAQVTILLLLFAVYQANRSNRVLRRVLLFTLIAVVVFVTLEMIGVIDFVDTLSWRWVAGQSNRYKWLRISYNQGGLGEAIFRAPPPWSLILRPAYLMISPLPIPSAEIERNWLSLGTMLQVLALPFVALGVWFMVRRRQGLAFLMALAMLFASVAFVTFTDRHLVMYAPFAILVAAYGYECYRERNLHLRWWYLGFYSVVLAAPLAYFVLKG